MSVQYVMSSQVGKGPVIILAGEGGGGGEIGGLQFFWDGIWGALKCKKMTLGGIFKFLLSSIPSEQQDA